MSRADMDLAIGLAAREGWNPGQADADSFYAADPNGFFVAEVEGRPVGTISAVRYQDDFGFIGLFIVLPEFRGRGYGMALWRHAMAYLDGCVVGLDSVLDQEPIYRRAGFVPAYRSVRHAGRGGGSMPQGVVRLDQVPFAEILRLDRQCFPAGRESFMRAWINAPGVSGYGVMHGDRLAGFGVIRPCAEGHKIGPLLADNADVAGVLLAALAAAVPGEQFFLDVIEPNAQAAALARSMPGVFTTVRMYAGGAPDTDMGRLFGVTSFELG
ncbi:MAG: GNAT family N-acetyltransferase [Proteobacteria bacterium]|nr:GNAT family N-acetyltransferase [Pseudomonadota bacterium]MBU4242855.1 GNAT family N-acetyltransferase [Pseudomonadota bacterium]MBU4379947.1 GNAT family N-acetyltransferase [Pseudomonadota bacterium]MBU4476010.1 GNAT family N-acetyltransferase [Pseudomonadota bacterium]MBU4517380.1 GNAT family N-acetyltransferase [Pseudomonadota bacterium]